MRNRKVQVFNFEVNKFFLVLTVEPANSTSTVLSYRRPLFSKLEEIKLSIIANTIFIITGILTLLLILAYSRVDLHQLHVFPNDVIIYMFNHFAPQLVALLVVLFQYTREKDILVLLKRELF